MNDYLPYGIPLLHYGGDSVVDHFSDTTAFDNLHLTASLKGNIDAPECKYVFVYTNVDKLECKFHYFFETRNDYIKFKLKV